MGTFHEFIHWLDVAGVFLFLLIVYRQFQPKEDNAADSVRLCLPVSSAISSLCRSCAHGVYKDDTAKDGLWKTR